MTYIRILPSTSECALSTQQTKPGTAAGPLADFPQVLKDFALYQPEGTNTKYYPHLGPFSAVAQLLLNAQLPPDTHQFVSSNWFMALHKDPDNPNKLRPIGMGPAWRRLIGKYLILVFAPQIAALFLLLGQLGIAVKGSIDLIVHTTKLQLELYLSPNEETRALPILDLENMFNKTSRITAQDELISHPILRTMLPFVQLLYNQPAHCFFQDSTNTTTHFLQEEGHCQGCPLAGFLSCLVLLPLHHKIQPMLAERALNRLQHR
jgi:hypothetical protein